MNDTVIPGLAISRARINGERTALAEQRPRQPDRHDHQLLQSLPAAVYTCDNQGRITSYNRRAAELWGSEPQLNDSNQKFCAAYKCWFDNKLLRPEETPMAVAVKEGKAFRNLECVFERADGIKLSVLVNIDPLLDVEGKLAGAVNVFQDVTERKCAEDQLRASEDRLAADLRAMTLLYEVGNECAIGGGEFHQCLHRIVEAAISVTGADRGNLQLLDRESGALKIAAQRGFEGPFLEFFSRVHGHTGAACAAAMETGQRIVVEDVTQSNIFAGNPSLKVMLDAGARAVQSVPLVSSAGH